MMFLSGLIIIVILTIIILAILFSKKYSFYSKSMHRYVYKSLVFYIFILFIGAVIGFIVIKPMHIEEVITEVPFSKHDVTEYNMDYIEELAINSNHKYHTEIPSEGVSLGDSYEDVDVIIVRKKANDNLIEVDFYESNVYLVDYETKKRYYIETTDNTNVSYESYEMKPVNSVLKWINDTERNYNVYIYDQPFFMDQFTKDKSMSSFDKFDIDFNWDTLVIRVPHNMKVNEDEMILIEEK